MLAHFREYYRSYRYMGYALSIIRASISIIQRRSVGPNRRTNGQSDRESLAILTRFLLVWPAYPRDLVRRG